MGYTKDLWKNPARRGKGKRWQANWIDPDGRERSKTFTTKAPADRYWRDMESQRDRGEYVDPKAGAGLVAELGGRWLRSLSVDGSTLEVYERCWRRIIEPEFGRRSVRSMTRPSEIKEFLAGVGRRYSDQMVVTTHYVLGAMLELAVADEELRRNPARSKIVRVKRPERGEFTLWTQQQVEALIDAHPAPLRALPFTLATTGLREGEAYGLSLDEVDLAGAVLHVRRQIKRVGGRFCWGLPKNDRHRDVPLGSATVAELEAHLALVAPVPVTLPWESPDGPLQTHRVLFTHPRTGRHLYGGLYAQWWKPGLVAAGLIDAPPPNRDGSPARHGWKVPGREFGRHQLRHYYANLQLAGGTNIRELSEYMGHHDPAFTLRVYGHLQPDSFERARQAVDARHFRLRVVSDGTGTEQGHR